MTTLNLTSGATERIKLVVRSGPTQASPPQNLSGYQASADQYNPGDPVPQVSVSNAAAGEISVVFTPEVTAKIFGRGRNYSLLVRLIEPGGDVKIIGPITFLVSR